MLITRQMDVRSVMELACAEQPISFVTGLSMRPYQLQALGWMIERCVCE